jgi:hypothetical protein
VDATTGASRLNESGDLDVRSAIAASAHDTVLTRATVHVEEHVRGGTLGAGWRRGLAEDNAAITVNGNTTIDHFIHRDQHGNDLGNAWRATLNANVSAFQVLSPTTVIDGSYGFTHQRGDLSNGWNAVPRGMFTPTHEVLPRSRTRHAIAARLSQHIPFTASTLKVWYRFYGDDFGLRAHTVELDAYQYLTRWLYVRGGYRFHRQNAARFFTTDFVVGDPPIRTADSDLAAFDAHEWSVQVATVRLPQLRRWSVTAELLRYARTNDLAITMVSLGLGRVL